MSKILIVDNDIDFARFFARLLFMKGYVAEISLTGADASQLLTNFTYNLLVMAWDLPGLSGEEICRTYRSQGGQVPVIFLAFDKDIHCLEKAFEAGADDFLRRPFDVRELSARVGAILKRRTGAFMPELRVGDIELHPERHMLVKGNAEVQLRAKEVSLLKYMMQHPDEIFSAQQLLERTWPSDGEGSTNSVRTWINLLRNKLTQIGDANLIRTVPGAGYMIDRDYVTR